MQQNALNHATLFLRDFGHIDKAFVGIVVVLFQHSHHPVGAFGAVGGNAVLHKGLDIASANGHVNDANAHVLGQILDHCAAEVIDWRQASVFAAQGRNGGVDFTHLAAHFREIDGGHHLVACVNVLAVNVFNLGVAFHIRLSEAEINVHLFVVLCINRQTCGNAHHC